MVNIGRRIKIMRNQYDLTQIELGILLGFSSSSAEARVSQYETGLRRPGKSIIKQITEIFGLSQQLLLSTHSDPIINIYIDLYWLLLMGIEVILISNFFDLIKEIDGERFEIFEELTHKKIQPEK